MFFIAIELKRAFALDSPFTLRSFAVWFASRLLRGLGFQSSEVVKQRFGLGVCEEEQDVIRFGWLVFLGEDLLEDSGDCFEFD